MMRWVIPFLIIFLSLTGFSHASGMEHGQFLVLTYHAIPEKVHPEDKYSVPQNEFVEQMEYLRTHGYHPVSLDDILRASEGKQDLPQKPVLLTFDDAYISYYEFVVPILERFGYPSVLAVPGSFIDNPPKDLPEPLMSWEQLKEVASKRLVELVSHTYDLHRGIQYNPQGNVWAAGAIRAYDSNTKTYETEAEYRARIEADFKAQDTLFSRHFGFTPRGIVWPYGKYTKISMEVARKAGYLFGFTLEEGYAHIDRLQEINRIMVENKPIKDFIKALNKPKPEKPIIRAVQVDLDLIYDPDSYEQMDQNLGKLIDRLVAMKVNTVFLQAFADPEATGNIKSVYFHNRVLPVRADIFSHAAHQMIIRDMTVYAWMPGMSIVLPDRELNRHLRVLETVDGKIGPSSSWYKRLSPFSREVREQMRRLYEDLASLSQIHGVLFQDDLYLTDYEDFHPSAMETYKEHFGRDISPAKLMNDEGLKERWMRLKTETLIDFTEYLMQGVRKYRPTVKFARNLYSKVITEPESEAWFAQNYELFLNAYDMVVIMAYPQMENAGRPSPWLEKLVKRAMSYPDGIEKTVFKIQSYDWERREWIDDKSLLEELRDILASGGKHIAYYPDNFWIGKPGLQTIKLEMSTRSYPFLP